MTTDVRALSDVDYALDVHVPAADLQPRVLDALKRQKAGMNLKGFRPGKVPMSVVRKMVGPQVAIEVAEGVIGEAYREAVVENEAYEVIGQPRLTDLDFEADREDADLKAVVTFGVRPTFELSDLSGVPVTHIVRTFTDEDVEADLQRRRDLAATEEDAPEGAVVEADSVVLVDIQPVDAEGTAVGPVQREARLLLSNPDLRQEMKDALLGQPEDATVSVELPHLHGADEVADPDAHVDRYRVTITDIKVRVVPEIDEAFIAEQTEGQAETLDAFKDQIREGLDRSWKDRARQALEQKMVEQFVVSHREAVPVPTSLTEASLDALVEELREKQDGRLPADFDVDGFREARRAMAEDQVRWLLVKDKLVHDEGIEVTSEDFEAEFAELAGGGDNLELIKSYFTQQPRLLEQMGDALLNRRVFDALKGRFTIVEKTREDIERDAEERRAALGTELTAAADDGA